MFDTKVNVFLNRYNEILFKNLDSLLNIEWDTENFHFSRKFRENLFSLSAKLAYPYCQVIRKGTLSYIY